MAKYLTPSVWMLAVLCAAPVLCLGGPQDSVLAPIKISVDATDVKQKVLHAQLEVPAAPGPLTLYYPKWMPADHSPDGPIANLVGLKFSSGGKPIVWRRDLVDMYTFHLDVPKGAAGVTVNLDFLLSVPGPVLDFAASATARLLILMWNQVLLYPSGRPADKITFVPTLRLPEGWKFATSLPVASQSGNAISFAPVPLDLLVDSPVQSGQFLEVIPLTTGTPPHEVDVLADHAWALDVPEELIGHYKHLVREAEALWQSHHYRDYHFLLTLSDNTIRLGQEHHESSDDRVAEHSLVDPNSRLLVGTLFPHEFTHSWNGQYRRPEGLATPDFQQPMKGELLWVYEGLTDYLGTILAARSGIWTPEQARENVASLASMLDHRAGRAWRPLQDTADAAQVLYFAPSEWVSYRRSTDFYTESVLLWLEVDVTLRKLTQGKKSLDDFCRAFFAGSEEQPIIKKYSFDEVVSTLNAVAPYDWRSLLRQRLDSTEPHAPLGGIAGGGWRLAYTDTPNEFLRAGQEVSGNGDFTSSLGLTVKADGTIQDVIPGMPGYQSGLSPYVRILAVDGQQFSMETLGRAVQNAKAGSQPIAVLTSNTGFVETHEVSYHGGLRGPHLQRDDGTSDYLSEILKPLTPAVH